MSLCTGCKHDVRHSCGCNHPLALSSAYAEDGDTCRFRDAVPEDTDNLRAEEREARQEARFAALDRADRSGPTH